MLVRETLVIHSRLSWRQARGAAAIERQHGLQALAIEHLAARLAGGFLQPINSDSLKEAIGEAIAMDLGEFNDIKTDIPQIGFGPSPILLPFGSFGKVESSSLAKDGALFICPAVPSLKNTDFPIIKTHLSLSFHSNA
jgi:hypothetical protein